VTPLAFAATSGADGVRITLHIQGFPLSDTPVDAGGPTAQASLDSLGNTDGYAALPDPGSLVISVPGLITGLASTGAVGLPPAQLPTLPSYPLAVTSGPTAPDVSGGAGPYVISAQSSPTATTAQAAAGLSLSGAGNASLITASASTTVASDGTVTSTATSDSQGLAIGPLTIGDVKSVATVTISPDGTVDPTSSLQIGAMQIGGVPVDLGPNGIDAAGTTGALPIQATLTSLLKTSGLSLTIEPTHSTSNSVVAPAVVLTAPVDLSGVGTAPGTMTVTFGGADATATPAAVLGGATTTTTAVLPPAAPVATGSAAGQVPDAPDVAGTPSLQAPAQGLVPAGPTAAPATAAAAPSLALGAARPTAAFTPPTFDLLSLYLVIAALAGAALLTGQLVRILGVRGPWKSAGS
jgi:hypothetical protein